MKLNLEDYLQQIDSAFDGKEQKEIYMTYIMIFAIIFAFAYLLFWDTSEASYKQKKAQVKTLEQKIAADKQFLQFNPVTKLQQLDSEIITLQKETNFHKDNNQYIKMKIEEISSLIYDEQTWGEYLHSISKNAKANNVKMLDFTNTLSTNTNGFGHVLDISIESYANYKNTINFINSLEQSDLVVDIHDFNIKENEEKKNKLTSTLKVSVWGITY